MTIAVDWDVKHQNIQKLPCARLRVHNIDLEILFDSPVKASYSKTCLKQPLKNRQNKNLNDKW